MPNQRRLTYYIGTTLDGFAAGPDDEVDFYPVSADHLPYMVATYPEVLPSRGDRAAAILADVWSTSRGPFARP